MRDTGALDPVIAAAVVRKFEAQLADKVQGMLTHVPYPGSLIAVLTSPVLTADLAAPIIDLSLNYVRNTPRAEHANVVDALTLAAALHPNWFTPQQLSLLTSIYLLGATTGDAGELRTDRHGNENRMTYGDASICAYTWPNGDMCGLEWDHPEPHREPDLT